MKFKRDAVKWQVEIEEVKRATSETVKRSLVGGGAPQPPECTEKPFVDSI